MRAEDVMPVALAVFALLCLFLVLVARDTARRG